MVRSSGLSDLDLALSVSFGNGVAELWNQFHLIPELVAGGDHSSIFTLTHEGWTESPACVGGEHFSIIGSGARGSPSCLFSSHRIWSSHAASTKVSGVIIQNSLNLRKLCQVQGINTIASESLGIGNGSILWFSWLFYWQSRDGICNDWFADNGSFSILRVDPYLWDILRILAGSHYLCFLLSFRYCYWIWDAASYVSISYLFWI